jgi:hypothetical protein
MLAPLLLALLGLTVSMLVQVGAVVVMLRTLIQRTASGRMRGGFWSEFRILVIVLVVLFTGHLVQIAIWAVLFVQIGEFSDFATAFYHSTVNFATLGYGDLVMSERWRLLGALQAASGVLMFGLSTSALFAVMTNIFQRSRMNREPMP